MLSADAYDADMAMMYSLVDALESEPEPFAFVEPILRLFEAHPDTYFGAPGPLVHFVEKFYRHGYEAILCSSFSRRPTRQTALMLNRLINGSSGVQKEEYVEMFTQALQRSDLSRSTSDEIWRFYALHTS